MQHLKPNAMHLFTGLTCLALPGVGFAQLTYIESEAWLYHSAPNIVQAWATATADVEAWENDPFPRPSRVGAKMEGINEWVNQGGWVSQGELPGFDSAVDGFAELCNPAIFPPEGSLDYLYAEAAGRIQNFWAEADADSTSAYITCSS